MTSICDLTCGYCPNRDMQRERTFMTDEVFDTILNKYIVPFRHVNLHEGARPTFIGHKDGEPLLNKKFPSVLRKLADACPDMNIDIYSHGLMLSKWELRGKDFMSFLATLPNRVRYMMSYHPFNHDGSVNDYKATNEYMRRILQSPPTNVEFIMVAHINKQSPAGSLEQWRESWRPEIERRVLTVHTNASINPWTGRMEDVATCKYNGCPYADFGHWFFGVTGNLVVCCMDLEEEIILGNVMTGNPDDLFIKTKEFYENQVLIKHGKSELKHEVCRNCFGMGKRQDLIDLGIRL